MGVLWSTEGKLMGYSQNDEENRLINHLIIGRISGRRTPFRQSVHECPFCHKEFEGVPKWCPHCRKQVTKRGTNELI